MKILVLAGGYGERFWPLSSKKNPKQLLSLITEKSMIRETIDRVMNFVPLKDIYVSTNGSQFQKIHEELYDIPKDNIIIEPYHRDTAAAIAYASMIISRNCGEKEVIAILASDHLIKEKKLFTEVLEKANERAKLGYIITLGIQPNRPETGYGYLKLEKPTLYKFSKVIDFVEKPNHKNALEYVKSKKYFWNSGMFVFKISTLFNEMQQHCPDIYNIIEQMKKIIVDSNRRKILEITKDLFYKFKKMSIDYALMEKTDKIECIPVNIGWNDIGNFNSLEEELVSDISKNISKNAKYLYIDSKNNIIISETKNKLITTIGVSNMIIVDTNEAIMVCNKKDSQRIKELLKKMEN